jgi:hypothetical protein
MRLARATTAGRARGAHQPRVAFFAGSDITTHLILARLVPGLRAAGVASTLFLTRAKPSRRRAPTLKNLFFVEHTLLQDHAYPYVDAYGQPRPDGMNSPEGWRRLGLPDVDVHEVADVNAPEFVRSLPAMGIDVAVSVRCYQKFREPILRELGRPDEGRYFVNLHPGLLPRYRGVNTFLRSMQNGEPEAGFTLHHLAADWDTGPVIGQARVPLDYARSVHENMLGHAADAAALIRRLADLVAGGHPVVALSQNHEAAAYYSHPGEDELQALRDRGVEVFRASRVVDTLVDELFGTVPDPGDLRAALTTALAEHGIGYQNEPAGAGRP